MEIIMAKELSTQAKWKPWKGILLFVIVIAWEFIGSIVGGLTGNATVGTMILQLGFLAIAIIATLINRTPLKEVFPLKKITVRDFFGTLIMWAGALPLGLMSAFVMGKLFPQTYAEVASSVSSAANSAIILGFITTVICPPICEESIMRGAIFSNFRALKKDWAICLIIGIFFGIFHLDYIRFFNTALLGGCMAYLMCKRNNIILPALFHFINNFVTIGISTLSSMFSQPSAEQAAQTAETVDANALAQLTSALLPGLMIAGCICPILLVIGSHLIKRQHEISEGKEKSGMKLGAKIGIAAIPSVLLLVGGIILMGQAMSGITVTQ